VAAHDHAVHAARQEGEKLVLLAGAVETIDQQVIVVLPGLGLDAADDLGEKRARDLGKEQGDCLGGAARQATRGSAGAVAQLLYCFEDLGSRLGRDLALLLSTRETVAMDTLARLATV
jgi:hypothetical protein